MTPRIGSLFSGYGGLEQGAQSVLGGTVAWHSEIDPAASKVLALRYPDVPNLGDITKVDWTQVEPVDVLTGGSPCQDVSDAGKRAGMKTGTRSGLWASMCDAIDVLRPGLVVWENVRGVLSAEADSALEPCAGCVGDRDDGPVLRALGRVLGDLASIGYDCRWHGLRAADIGAPHGRFRVFVVAHPAGDSRWFQHRDGAATVDAKVLGHERRGSARRGRTRSSDGDLLPTPRATDGTKGGPGQRGSSGDLMLPSAVTLLPTIKASNNENRQNEDRYGPNLGMALGITPGYEHRAQDWGIYAAAITRWEAILGRAAPAPTQPSKKGTPQLSPQFSEWMMGLLAGWVTDVPGLTRNDMLRILGNGVVSQQAALAVRTLLGVEAVAA